MASSGQGRSKSLTPSRRARHTGVALASTLAAAMGLAVVHFPATMPAIDTPDPSLSRSYSISRTADRVDIPGPTVHVDEDPALTMTVVNIEVPPPSRREQPGSAPKSGPVCISSPIAPGQYRVSSAQGMRKNPFTGRVTLHAGVDLAAPFATKIHAVADGVVTYTGPGRAGRSSELVIIDHEVDGTRFSSWYVHMYPDGVFVEAGQYVASGEVIAEVGSNGNSTGPHLHFEIHTSPVAIGGAGGAVILPGMRVAGPNIDLVEPGAEPDEAADATTTPPPPDPTMEPDPGATPAEDPHEDPTGDPTGDSGATPLPTPQETPTDDPSADPGTDPSGEPPTDPGPDPSTDPGADPTDDPDSQPGEEAGTDPSDDTQDVDAADPTDADATDAGDEEEDEEERDEAEESEEAEDIIIEVTDDLGDSESLRSRPTGIYDPSSYGVLHDPLPFLMGLGYGISSPSSCHG